MNNANPQDSVRRRDFLKLGSAAAIAALASQTTQGQTMTNATKRPNIVFFFSDEHRWCSLPFTQMPAIRTPNMALLAKQGTRFDNCCASSPVCTPYRGMLITGMWPHQSSVISNDYFGNHKIIGQEAPTIGHTFKDAGYTTGYVGKWHLGEENVFHTGFDYFHHWLYGDDHYNSKVRNITAGETEYKVETEYNATTMTDRAVTFIADHAKDDKPFFLMLSINPPHWRWDDAPPEFLKQYPQDKLPFRPNVTDDKYKKDEQLLHYQHYHAHIAAVDQELGRVMDALKQQGLDDNTILIYTSDHGSSFGSNGVTSKANPYDESAHVPFIIRWPGKVKSERIADHNLGTMDIYPTLCGLAGFKAPKHCGGQDFTKAVLDQSDAPDPKSQFLLINNFQRNYYRTQLDPDKPNIFYPFRAVRSKTHTYAVRADGEWFLYDNINDPYQLKNLLDDPASAGVKKEMQAEMTAWLAKAEDPFISDEWKAMSLPDRIAAQNRYYSLLPFKKQLDQYRVDAVKPYLNDVKPRHQAALRAAAERVFDEAFFGRYRAFSLELTLPKRNSQRPLDEIKTELAAHEAAYAKDFKVLADALGALR